MIGTNTLASASTLATLVVLNDISGKSTTNTVTRGALFTFSFLFLFFLTTPLLSSGFSVHFTAFSASSFRNKALFVQLYCWFYYNTGGIPMNRPDWLSDPAWIADTSPDQERQIITGVRYNQELERLQQQLDELLPLVLRVAMRELEATNPTFLALPSRLAAFRQDRLYQLACLQGRLFYRADQYSYDEEWDRVVYTPVQYTRAMIHDRITSMVHISDDTRLASTIPLALRVGQVVGWLSGLSVSQKDDAQAGLVLLATLVAPLLFPTTPGRASTSRNKRLPASSRSGSRSHQSHKK
jgi:hypothetical protein